MAGTSLTRGRPQAGAELGRDSPGWPTGRRFKGRRALGTIFAEMYGVGFSAVSLSEKHNQCYRVFWAIRPPDRAERRSSSSPSFGGLEFGELRYTVRESHNQLKCHKITVIWKIATCGKVAEKGA
jgi:hypothetical protein